MAYCAICGTNHSPDYPCSCYSAGTLHDIGIKSDHKMPGEEFHKLEKRADRYMLKIVLIVIIGFIILIAAMNALQRFL